MLVTSTWAYRISEYKSERCTGEQVGVHRLAGPSACDKLNIGVAESVLVKIDNAHDNQYQVIVYDNEDCTGSVVGTIANTNGCLNLDAFESHVGKSVKVVPVSSNQQKRESVGNGFDIGPMYNFDGHTNGEELMVPLMHGGFHAVKRFNHSDNGTYMDEAIATFYPLTLEHLLDLEDLWSGSSKSSKTTSANELNNSSPINMLDERDLRWARCQFNTLCAVAVELGGDISNSDFANGIRRIMGNIPWKKFHSGVNYILGYTANSMTIASFIQTSGTHNTSCDSNKSSGELAQDLVRTLGNSVTNANFQVEDDNGNKFELAVYLYPKGEMNANTNNCGKCATCL